ncbi:YdcF family protein [Lysinibacillus odysseyi]|uniref:YdcF family protein n=1 Tax=Lysinibacillus odysseyi TaxID=202611 RepID=UPI000690357A|nr:YdcF family protein [Lysinibacillus odysseyi]
MRIHLTYLLLLLVSLPLLLASWLPSNGHEDPIVIVLGTKLNEDGTPSSLLKSRLDAALAYANIDEGITYIVSGAGEAAVMKEYLMENGIDEKQIKVEDKAVNTYENILFSAKLLPDDSSSFTIISSDFHVYRAQAMASSLGYNVHVISAETPFLDRLYWQIREVAALAKFWMTGS